MGRPKGSKNKPKTAPPKAKAKAKAKSPARVSKPDTPPDWLRKAMAVKPTKPKVGRKPDVIKAKFKAITAKARRGKTMANISKDKPLPDPELDPDFGAPAARFGGDAKPSQLPAEEQVKLPEERRTKGTKLTEEQEPEVEPLYDEVAAGEDIPPENAEALIAGTLGGSGDHHASAKRILQRFEEANWTLAKGAEGTPAGQAIKTRREAQEKARKEAERTRNENDPKGADAGKGRGKNDPKGADDQKGKK